MDLENVESTVSQKDIYTGKYISLKVCTVEKQKGYAQRELVEHNGTLMIIALLQDNKLVLDKIYRKSIEKFSLEVPNKRIDSSENHIDVLKAQMMGESMELLGVVCRYFEDVRRVVILTFNP